MVTEGVPRVLVCDALPKDALTPLEDKGYRVDFQPNSPQEELSKAIGDYDAVILRSGKKITADVLENPGRLQVIARAGVGVDNIDVNTATQKGILVVNTPDGNSIAVAELVMAQMLAMARHTHDANISTREGRWEKKKFRGIELRGKRLGIVGLGNVGRALAPRALAFEMDILGYDPAMTEERAAQMGVRFLSLQRLLEESDFITVHVPLNVKTKGLINGENLKFVKPGARIINAARGGIIDEQALVEALNDGQLAGAALDVFADEPNVLGIIRSHPKIILTPHLGASTEEAEERVAEEAVRAVIDALEGRFPKGTVNLPKISEESYRKLVPFLPLAEAISTLALWLSEGRSIQKVEAHFLGEIAGFDDLRPLRAALVRGLIAPDNNGSVVNLINYREAEEKYGLHISEHRQDTNGVFASSIKIALVHKDGTTTVSGVDAHGSRIVEIDGYPVEFPIGRKHLLICRNDDKPGKVAKVAAVLDNSAINIDALSVGSHPQEDGSAMMVYALDTVLTNEQMHAIQSIEGIRTVTQFTI